VDEVVKLQGKLSYRVEEVPYRKSFTVGQPSSIPYGRIEADKQELPTGVSYRIRVIPDRRSRLDLEQFHVTFTLPVTAKSCFLNGFQSWTESCELPASAAQKPFSRLYAHWVNKYQLRQFGGQTFNPYAGKPGIFSGYTYGYVRHPDNLITLVGSLDESGGYTIVRIDTSRDDRVTVTVEKECFKERLDLQEMVLSFFLGTGEDEQMFDSWHRETGVKARPAEPVLGWTSWYSHYRNISRAVIDKNLKAFSQRGIPLQLFQIDDGWQTAVGDWLSIRDTFPEGMADTARAIRREGYTPGLWIAPFTAEESSQLCRDHADWIIRNEHGPVKAGTSPLHWGGAFYGLDIYHPEVREYLRRVFHTIVQVWGFQMIKADFLYTAALEPRGGRSRGRIMHDALAFLRELTGDRLLLGCGVPLGSAFGTVHYCRVGSDIAPVWEDRHLKAMHFPERVSTANSLASTIGRRQLNGRFFHNDPDVIVLRESRTRLTSAQKQVLFFVNNLFGSLVFTSDNPEEYTDSQLQRYCSAFPLVRKTIRSVKNSDGLYVVDFTIRETGYSAVINLSGKSGRYILGGGEGTAWYSEEFGIVCGGREQKVKGIEAHCWVKVPAESWKAVGTTGRLFPGSEIDQIFKEDDELMITFREGTLHAGDVIVRLPEGTKVCMINNNSALIYEENGITVGRASLI
jgi:alpha-galactosidase